MYFVRTYKSGGEDWDPRQKIWAEFHCALCDEDSDIDVTRVMDTFQFDRERKCPHCGCLDADDREKNLKAQLEKLTHDKSKIEVEIEKIERELNDCTTNQKTSCESER